jgi:LTXXQ motif family protein
MRNKPWIAFVTALSLATAGAPLIAAAQTAGAPGAAQQQQRHAPHERPSRIEGRIAFLKAELKITDAQTAQWNALADTMRKDDAARRERMHQARATHAGAPNALDALAKREQSAEARVESVRSFAAAFRPLYASLSDEQKRTADELLGRHGGPGGHGGHQGGHHGGWRH